MSPEFARFGYAYSRSGRAAGKVTMAPTDDELEWLPVEVLWDERVPDEPGQYWERPSAPPAYQAQPESRTRRVRPFHDDTREQIERFGPRRKRNGEKPRRKKFRLEDIDTEDS